MKVIGFALFLGMGLLTACSSDEEQGEEKLENDMNENAEGSENGANSQEGGEENAEGSSENAEGSSENAEESEGGDSEGEAAEDESAPADDDTALPDATDAPPAEAMPEEAPPEAAAPMDAPALPAPAGDASAAAAPAAAPAPASGAAAAAPPPGMWDPSRLVRFVNADGTPIYATAQVGGQTVGTLRKGDHVMVLMQGEWGMVSESAYIQGSALSAKALPRTMGTNDWIQPSE
jgi:hypothetical protein